MSIRVGCSYLRSSAASFLLNLSRLLSPDPARLEEALEAGLVSPDHLLHDIPASLNAAELGRRQFREIARVAGLIFQGYPVEQQA